MEPSLLLEWWNLIFIAPFALAVLYLGLYIASGWTFGDPDADVGVDGDADVDIDADADIAGELGLEGDAVALMGDGVDLAWDPAMGIAGGAAGGEGAEPAPVKTLPWVAALQLFGVGRVPLSVLLMILLFSWGIVGFISNSLLVPEHGPEAAWYSLGIAATGALLATALLARLVHRVAPMNESYVTSRWELVRQQGEAISTIDATFGRAIVRDRHGDRHEVTCRTGPGAEPIARGTPIVLVRYSPQEQTFYAVTAGWWEAHAEKRAKALKQPGARQRLRATS